MKKFLLVSLVIAYAFCAKAQNNDAKESTPDPSLYNRCSLTIIPMVGGGYSEDGVIVNYTASWNQYAHYGKTFDLNPLDGVKINQAKAEDVVSNELKSINIGKKVLDKILGYDGKVFNLKELYKRSHPNTTTADLPQDNTSKNLKLDVNAKILLKNAYVMAIRPHAFNSNDHSRIGGEFSGVATCFIYHVDISDSLIEKICSNWLDENATDANREAYENLTVPLTFATRTGSAQNGFSPEGAVQNALISSEPRVRKAIFKWHKKMNR